MEVNEEKGVFGWYRPAEGLALALRAEWRPPARKAAGPIGLELAHFSAEEGVETPIAFNSIRSMAEFLARNDETMNDGLNRLSAWGGLEIASGLAASWPAAEGGEVRLRFGPLGTRAAEEFPPARASTPPAQIYDHEAGAAIEAGRAAKTVLAKILQERDKVEVALRSARAEVGGLPHWAERIALMEAESLEWKRVANSLYGNRAGDAAEAEEAQEPPPAAPETGSRTASDAARELQTAPAGAGGWAVELAALARGDYLDAAEDED